MHAEVIFEDGSKSIIEGEEDGIKSFLTEHHQRALDGKPGAPQDQEERTDLSPEDFTNMPPIEFLKSRPAVRIYKVYTYDGHPMDLVPTTADAKELKSLIDGMAHEGQVDPEQLVRAVRDEVSPVFPVDQGLRESIYKAEADGEMDLSFLPTSESG
jgi:hypothetical protein